MYLILDFHLFSIFISCHKRSWIEKRLDVHYCMRFQFSISVCHVFKCVDFSKQAKFRVITKKKRVAIFNIFCLVNINLGSIHIAATVLDRPIGEDMLCLKMILHILCLSKWWKVCVFYLKQEHSILMSCSVDHRAQPISCHRWCFTVCVMKGRLWRLYQIGTILYPQPLTLTPTRGLLGAQGDCVHTLFDGECK